MSETTEHEITFRPSPQPVEYVEAPVTRIAQLLALAIQFERLLRSGEIESPAEMACRYGISRSRVSQILNLTNLAPAIQEAILLSQVDIPEGTLRPLVAEPRWETQMRQFLPVVEFR